jgi:transposase-like protein
MRKISTYSAAFKEQALSKVLSRGDRSVQSVADELNVSVFTLKNWMKRIVRKDLKTEPAREKRPQDWSLQEQLIALHESHGLQGEALNAWCREKGLFVHHLDSWKASFCAGNNKEDGHDAREWRSLKDENQQLKRELLRKEKALAEAAALLVLQKKFQALWVDEVK